MEDVDVGLWFGQGTALYLAVLAVAIGLVNFFRTFRMLKVEKRTRIAVEALIANNQLSQLDETLRRHFDEWSALARRASSDEIRTECDRAHEDIRRISERNDKLRELVDAVECSLDSVPAALVSYSLLEKTHREFVHLRECVMGEIEQVEAHGQRLDRVRAELASLREPAQIVIPTTPGSAEASSAREMHSAALASPGTAGSSGFFTYRSARRTEEQQRPVASS